MLPSPLGPAHRRGTGTGRGLGWGALRGAPEGEPLEPAAADELEQWTQDDKLYGAAVEPDVDALGSALADGGRPKDESPGERTATRLPSTDRLEQPQRPTPPERSAAFVKPAAAWRAATRCLSWPGWGAARP